MKIQLTHYTYRNSIGFSTIEILIAFSVGIIFLTAAMMVSFSDPTLARQISLDSGPATALDATLDNTALATSSNKLGRMIAALTGNWNATTVGDSDSTYTNTPNIVDISPCLKQISNATTWTTLGSRGRLMTFGTALGDMTTAIRLGRGGCDPLPPGDWDNPDTFGSFDPSGINNANAGIMATAIAAKPIDGKLYVFLTSQHGSEAVADFWIIDVTDPQNPVYVSSLDISNGLKYGGAFKEGANDVVIVGDYAYILRNYKTDQLQVINISDLNNPVQVLPAISFESRGVNKNGTDPQGEVLKYDNGKLYVGLKTTQGPEFLVYQIISNPAIPTFVGNISNSFNHSITDIEINNTYAYVSINPGSGGGAQNTKELMVLNISGANPTNTGVGYNANNANNDTEAATALYLLGSKLYLARAKVNNPKKDFFVFDVTTPATPTIIASANLNQASGGAIKGMYVSKHLAFLGSSKNPEFQIWDVSNPTVITSFGCGGLDFPQEVSDVTYANNYIFATIRSNEFLRIIHDETSDTTCH